MFRPRVVQLRLRLFVHCEVFREVFGPHPAEAVFHCLDARLRSLCKSGMVK